MNQPLPIKESTNPKADTLASKQLVGALQDFTSFRHADQFGSLVSFLTSNLQTTVANRDTYFNQLDEYRNNYIVNGIYDIVSSDVFVDNGTAEFLTIKIDKYPEAEAEIDKLFKKLNLSNLLISVLPDMLHYGAYPIKPIVRAGKGVIDLVDDLNPRQVIAVTDSKGSPLMFFVSSTIQNKPDPITGTQMNRYTPSRTSSYEYLPIDQLIYFSIDLSFSKLSLPEKTTQQLRRKATDVDLAKKLLPTGLKLRSSQSFIWPVMDKLKEVLLLDKLSVYRDIGSILTPNLVGIPVPDVYDPVQLIEITKKYDELLNSNVARFSNSQSLELTLQELASVKVVPIVGDKSTPSTIDVGRSVPLSSTEAVNDSLSRLLNSLGIPKELFDGSMESKTNLKTNIRYAKKIKRIQRNIVKSLTFLALLHLSEKFPSENILYSDINISLRNNTNIDELENMEAQDLVIASVANIKSLVENIEPLMQKSVYEIDADKLVENIQASFSSLGSNFQNIFKRREPDERKPVAYTNSQDDTFQDDTINPNQEVQ